MTRASCKILEHRVLPKLSVIVASSLPSRGDLFRNLAKTTEGGTNSRVEIIVALADGILPSARTVETPGIVVLNLPESTSLPSLLGKAIAVSTGDIVAITDAACGVTPQWCEAVFKAHEKPYEVIGGAVEPGELKGVMDWTAYFYDYGQFMLPFAEGVANNLPGINISMKRNALARGSEFAEGEFWKTYWCKRIQAEGNELYLTPSIVAHYCKSFRFWDYLVNRFQSGRCFAGMRNAKLGTARRMIYLIGSPLLPFLIYARVMKAVVCKRRHLGRFFFCSPMIFIAAVHWALGEAFGYFSGTGKSCRNVK